jgi:hypothetical protein
MEADGSETEGVTWNDSNDGSVGPKVDEDGDWNDMVVTWW